MPRPKLPRTLCGTPPKSCFKPNGIPMAQLKRVALAADEFEALRLVDLEGMQQIQAAAVMGVSRQTLANIVKTARRKVVSCLANGHALSLGSMDDN